MSALRRLPPAVLALIATALVAAVVVVVFVLAGGGRGRQLPPCTDTLQAGPYGCVVFISIDGTQGGARATQPEGGAVVYRVEREGGRDRLVRTNTCGDTAVPVTVTATRYRLGAIAGATCGTDPADAWAAQLFTGEVRIDDRADGTVVLAQGDRTARFAQAVASR